MLSGSWCLLRSGKLFNIKDDPGQPSDVADKHPEAYKRLNEAYHARWANIEPGFAEPTHVIVGSKYENPSVLTSHDWRGKVSALPWGQNHIKSGSTTNNYWETDFAHEADYRILLARWPQEAERAIRDGSQTAATPMTLVIDGQESTKPISEADKAISFQMKLKAGQKRIQGGIRGGGKDIFGPYCCTLERLLRTFG